MQDLLLQDLITLHALSENVECRLYLIDGGLEFGDSLLSLGEGVVR